MSGSILLATLLPSMLALQPAWAAQSVDKDFELQLIPYDIKIRDYQFPSGLRIVFQEDHTRPLVSVTSVFDVGAAHEPDGLAGMAHVIEHLNFRARHGTLPKNMDLIKQFGGGFNATTREDYTNYMTIAPVDALVPILKLESLRMVDAVEGVTDEVLKTEREVVRNELRMNLEQGPGEIWGWLSEGMYPKDHPYGHTVIGTHETINNITMKDVRDFVKKYYTPPNTTIVVVGDFNMDDTWKYIQESFPIEQLVDPKDPSAKLDLVTLPPRMNGPSAEPPPPVSQKLATYTGPVDKKTILIGWSLPGAFRGQDSLMGLTVQMMNYAVGKHLFPDWDYKLEENTAFGCFFQPGAVASAAYCYIETDGKEKPERLVDRALDGLYELWNTDNRYQAQRGQYVMDSIPLDQLFKWAKLSWMSGQFDSVESVSSLWGRAATVAEHVHYTGDPLYYSRQFQEVATVDPFNAANFAYKYLNRDRYTAILVEPYSDEEKAQLERKGLENQYTGVTRDDMNASLFAAGTLTDETIKKAVVPPDFKGRKVFTMENGLNVVIIPHSGSPVARSKLLFLGGQQNTRPYKRADYTFDFLKMRIDKSPLEFAGGMGWGLDATTSQVASNGSAGNIKAQLWLLREALKTLDVEIREQGKYLKGMKSSRDESEQKPETWSERFLWGRLLPDHTLSRYLTDADLEVMKKWGKTEAMDWVNQVFQPSDAVLFVVGNLDPEKTEADVRALFADWLPKKGAEVGPAPGLERSKEVPNRQILVFDKVGATQTELAFGCMLPEARLDNYPARNVLSEVLTEILWRELRETAGATYGAYAYQQEYRGGLAILGGSSLLSNNAVGLAVKTIYDGLQSIRDGKTSSEELQTIKWNFGRTITTQYQTTQQVIDSLAGMVNRGWPVDAVSRYPELIASVKNSDLQTLLDPCIGHEVITIVGPKESILKELEAKGFKGEVVDWQALIQNKEYKKDEKKEEKKENTKK